MVWVPERDGCIHGRRIDQDCRLCELIVEKEMQRRGKKVRDTKGIWLMILAGLTFWLCVILWRIKG